MYDILIVEDDFSTRTNITDLLTENGYNVFSAEDGAEGINKAKEIIPDLIISDIMMPHIDGIELYKTLSGEPLTEDIPFIFLSARSEPFEIRQGMELGADDYITKPFRALELLNAVQTRLKKRRVRDQKMKALTDNISLSLPHELRTPLVAILGYSQLLKEIDPEQGLLEIASLSERIEYAGNRLNDTIQKFLIYSEIEFTLRDRMQLKRIRNCRCINNREIITYTAAKAAEKFTRESDIQYNIQPAQLLFNCTYLQYIVNELIENACKFSEPGTEIIVSGKIENDKYLLTVKDKGRGMSVEEINNAGAGLQFEKEYFQQSGIGMGLAIVKGLCELHDGKVMITSRKNEYTNVNAILPLAKQSN